jgi:hypothetical protein
MATDGTEWTSIGGRFTHGTATPFVVKSVLPAGKEAKETFWVRAVVSNLPEFADLSPQIRNSPSDANGGPDVLISLPDSEIGVQVTELTCQRSRMRQAQMPEYVAKVLQAFEARGVNSRRKLTVLCTVQDFGERTYTLPRADHVAAVVERFLSSTQDCPGLVAIEGAQLLFTWVDDGHFYVPSVGNIGFDTNVSELSRSPSAYRVLVDDIVTKKGSALAPWLVIWSLSFWRDRHFCETPIVEYMRSRFTNSPFERVFFINSMDGEGFFEKNVRLRSIAPSTDRLPLSGASGGR